MLKDFIHKTMEGVCDRYSRILDDYYPSFKSIGFTERNLTYNFCSQYEKLRKKKSLVVWQEAPLNPEICPNQHIDSLIIDWKNTFLIEAKRLNAREKVDSVVDDIDRLKKIATTPNLLNGVDGRNLHFVILADIWIPRGETEGTKTSILKDFKEKVSNKGFEILLEKVIEKHSNKDYISENEEYMILCAYK